MPTIRDRDLTPEMRQYIAEYAVDSVRRPKPKGKPKLVQPGVCIEPHRFTAVLPIETTSEVNQRKWRATHRRNGAAWKAVSAVMGPHLGALAQYAEAYHSGQALRLTFTRIGGRHLDGMANLGTSMKAAEDAVAFMLGANDGDPRWHAVPEQEDSDEVGVLVEIEVCR